MFYLVQDLNPIKDLTWIHFNLASSTHVATDFYNLPHSNIIQSQVCKLQIKLSTNDSLSQEVIADLMYYPFSWSYSLLFEEQGAKEMTAFVMHLKESLDDIKVDAIPIYHHKISQMDVFPL